MITAKYSENKYDPLEDKELRAYVDELINEVKEKYFETVKDENGNFQLRFKDI